MKVNLWLYTYVLMFIKFVIVARRDALVHMYVCMY